MAESIIIPPDLEANAVIKFDDLVDQGKILYEEARWKRVEDGNVTVNLNSSTRLEYLIEYCLLILFR